MANHSRILAMRTMNCIKKQKDTTRKDELPRPEGAQYATREKRRTTTVSCCSRKNDVAGPKGNRYSVVDVSGNESKIRCCKEQQVLHRNLDY